MCKKARKAGFEPHLYLHPYEFDISIDFKVGFHDLRILGLKKAIYWSIRQNQWLSFRNQSTKSKLSYLIKEDPLKGKLCESLISS